MITAKEAAQITEVVLGGSDPIDKAIANAAQRGENSVLVDVPYRREKIAELYHERGFSVGYVDSISPGGRMCCDQAPLFISWWGC